MLQKNWQLFFLSLSCVVCVECSIVKKMYKKPEIKVGATVW